MRFFGLVFELQPCKRQERELAEQKVVAQAEAKKAIARTRHKMLTVRLIVEAADDVGVTFERSRDR